MEPSYYAELFGIIQECQNCQIFQNETLAPYTSFRIGGDADVLVLPETIADFLKIIHFVTEHKIPYKIIGNASNLLIDDCGFRGVVIKTTSLERVSVDQNILVAECGASLARCARRALESSCSGFERLGGIPGTVGGALAMNAGAFETEIADILLSVTLYDTLTRQTTVLTREQLSFGYRSSMITDRRYIALSASFSLVSRPKEEILSEMKTCMERRRSTQPLNLPSAGSVFKRPPNDYAGRLIEAAGLKGTRIGDAEVSCKHAGFIVNRGNATAEDVKALIRLVQQRVREMSDVLLVCEIEILSEG